MKFPFAIGCLALVTLGFSPASKSDPDSELYNQPLPQQPEEYRAGSHLFKTMQDRHQRNIEELDRQIAELKSPHWVCMLTVYPKSAKKPADDCTLVENARMAEELASQRRGYLEFAVGASAILLSLLLGFVTLHYIWRRFVRSAAHTAGAVTQKTSNAAKAGAHMAGRVSAVFTDKTSDLAQAFREGRESVKRARPD